MFFLATKSNIKTLFVPCVYPSLQKKNETNLSPGILSEALSPTMLSKDSVKLAYQLDYPLSFKRTPAYARLTKPPCRSFGEWIRKNCGSDLSDGYIDYSLTDLVNLFNSTREYVHSVDQYLINGGANDGLYNDPLYVLFTKLGFPGIAVELSREPYEKLKLNLPASNIVKLNAPLEPHTVHQLLVNNEVPLRPIIMKMDIDGYDYAVVRSIFFHSSNNSRTEYAPAFVMVEMNEKFPPPINFYTRYRPYYGF